VDPHKGARKVLVAIDHPLLELAVSPRSKEVDTIGYMVDGMEEGLDGREELVPDHHVLWELHVRRKGWGTFLC